MSEKSVDDRCKCGHFRDYHGVFAGACREDDCRCGRFRRPEKDDGERWDPLTGKTVDSVLGELDSLHEALKEEPGQAGIVHRARLLIERLAGGGEREIRRTEMAVFLRRIRHGLKDGAGSMDARKALRDLADRYDLDLEVEAP